MTGPGPFPTVHRRSRTGRAVRAVVPPLVALAALLLLWDLASRFLLDPDRRFLLPPPSAVLREGFLRWEHLHPLLDALWLTTRVAMAGLVLATLVGVGAAVVMSQAPWIERSVYPVAVAVQAVPVLALVPLIGLWFGFDFASRVVVCVLVAVFPILANTLFGILSVDRAHHDLFTLNGAGRLTRLRKLQLPAALPALLVGLRIAAGLAVVGAIVGDFHFRRGQPGLGILIDTYRARLQSEQLFAAVILASLLGIAVFWAFGVLAHRLVGSWSETGRPEP